uniref:Uncharacterized protein n=1 Tax=[Tolypothrix] sp. PCC 7415 TaxID=373957 RepID=A0A2P0ZG97_9CYAN|nr:hypothetical protein [[Tolypothrix] sp. PCC 7415]
MICQMISHGGAILSKTKGDRINKAIYQYGSVKDLCREHRKYFSQLDNLTSAVPLPYNASQPN